jgi:hypothetical protein
MAAKKSGAVRKSSVLTKANTLGPGKWDTLIQNFAIRKTVFVVDFYFVHRPNQ